MRCVSWDSLLAFISLRLMSEILATIIFCQSLMLFTPCFLANLQEFLNYLVCFRSERARVSAVNHYFARTAYLLRNRPINFTIYESCP